MNIRNDDLYRPAKNDNVDAYITTFLPSSDADKGHTRLDLYEPNSNQKVMMTGLNGQQIPASLSVYPSSRRYEKFPAPFQMIADYFGINFKTNLVADLTGVPVEGFSVKDYEADIKYQRKSPSSIQKVTVPRNTVSKIEDKHDNLKKNKDLFVLDYNTAFVPYIMKCIDGAKISSKNFNSKLGYSNNGIDHMPEDLVVNGGGYLCDIPDKSAFPNHYNCSGAVHNVLHTENVLPEYPSTTSIYPNHLQQMLSTYGAIEMKENLELVPDEIRHAVTKAKHNYPNPNTMFGRAMQNIGCEPNLEGDLLASVFDFSHKEKENYKNNNNRT